jgi:hypothetical protein
MVVGIRHTLGDIHSMMSPILRHTLQFITTGSYRALMVGVHFPILSIPFIQQTECFHSLRSL